MPREVPWHVLIRTRTTIISAFAFLTPFYADPKLTTGLTTVHTYLFDATYPYLRIYTQSSYSEIVVVNLIDVTWYRYVISVSRELRLLISSEWSTDTACYYLMRLDTAFRLARTNKHEEDQIHKESVKKFCNFYQPLKSYLSSLPTVHQSILYKLPSLAFFPTNYCLCNQRVGVL